jgi:hypothetical protein
VTRSLPTFTSSTLCRTFTAESAKVWNDLGAAWAAGRIYDEETITNVLLADVERAHPQDVAAFQFYKPQETITGADWEWWLSDGTHWFGVLIQAKRVTIDTGKYQGIKHAVGSARTPQVDLLLHWASCKDLDPLYIFYNCSQAPVTKFKWNCGRDDIAAQTYGCTVAHATTVKRVLKQGGAGLPKMSRVSYPLRCLVCCPVVSNLDNSLPDRTHDVVRALRELARDLVEDASAPEARSPRLRDEPPKYVRDLLAAAPGDRRHVVEDYRRQIGPVKRLVITIEHHFD